MCNSEKINIVQFIDKNLKYCELNNIDFREKKFKMKSNKTSTQRLVVGVTKLSQQTPINCMINFTNKADMAHHVTCYLTFLVTSQLLLITLDISN
ncbi:hypothetical protein BpHYR1_022271 [Brachionus plicatilis]|uniref:Uncharacterized protein n=1 Tax=Brachionus plicatilis TaxID=10195 RepID=A0A3M7RES4_BRAPC|nr:hypothetical protein BpHYR1_022271 [Brachionus plicatilis]